MGLHITLLTQEPWPHPRKAELSQLFLYFPFVTDNERIGDLTSVAVITEGEVYVLSTAATLSPSDQRTGAKGDSEIPHVSSSQPLLDLKNMFQTWSPLRGKDGDCGRVSSSTHAKD